ncbi:MAG: universal stress protein [Actinomycetota bacterium]|nr:universal stress protein [Actinomycetota bacterium]
MAPSSPYRGRVVVGFDGSPASATAAAWAAEEATVRGRGLTVVHAILPPVMTGGLGVGLPASAELVEQMEEGAREQVRELVGTLDATDVEVQVTIGGPSGVLLEASEEADLVVIGSRGRGGFAGLLIGSVSAQVAAHAECPVVVVRGVAAAGARDVVVGVDGSDTAQAAIAFAFDEASRRGWSVIAVHAWDIPAYDLLIVPNGPVPIPLADVADDEVRLTAELLAGFRESYPDVDVQEHLVHGPPVSSLLDASPNPAMIVVGTRGHGPAIGALLGSVSNGVLHKAHVPVAVIARPATPLEAA